MMVVLTKAMIILMKITIMINVMMPIQIVNNEEEEEEEEEWVSEGGRFSQK